MPHKERKITIEIEGERPKSMYFTPATDEQFIVKEILIDECYDFDFNKDDVVLNLGGNIGAFEVTYADKVKEIITFEPDGDAYTKLKKHIKLNNITNVSDHNVAISYFNGFIPFSDKELKGHNGYDINGTREAECVDINSVCNHYKPNKIKCDIEGYEYELFENFKIPDYVDEIWLETHVFNSTMLDYHIHLMVSLRNKGFNIKEIRNDEYDRTYLVHAKRPRLGIK